MFLHLSVILFTGEGGMRGMRGVHGRGGIHVGGGGSWQERRPMQRTMYSDTSYWNAFLFLVWL